MVLVAGLVVGTGGGAAPVVAPVVQTMTAGEALVATVLEEATMSIITGGASTAAANVAAGAPALIVAGTGGAATTATTTAVTTVAAANSWNPVGWIIGTVLVGAGQCAPHTVTWSCYKPIIDEADNEAISAEPITLAALAVHPKVQRISVGSCAASAGLPEVEVANTAGERYLLRGVALPWGGAAYHAERVDNERFF